MNPPVPTRHPWKALAAIIAMAAAVHAVHAAASGDEDDDAPAQVHVVGRLPVHEACLAIDDDLSDELSDDLAQAWQDAEVPVTVPVQFKLRGDRVFDVIPTAQSSRLQQQVRRAVRSLQCDSHDDQVHLVNVIVRFVDRADGSHEDSVTQLAIDDAPRN